MLEKVRGTIKKYGMLKKGDTVCVAVSGGVDSVVLLHLLSLLRDELSLSLVVCHLNHNLRGGESERDFRFVRGLAKGMGLAFEGKKLTGGEVKGRRGESLQMWARGRRLKFLKDAARNLGADKIALGHNLDDQSETVLMRFIKGAGLRGLGGILPAKGEFIRPLIEIERADIERYAGDNNIRYVSDSTNRTPKYLRNRVRLELIPFIEGRYNPNIKDTLARCASILRGDEDYLLKESERAFRGVLTGVGKESVIMDGKKLLSLHPALSSRVFLKAIETLKQGLTNGVYAPQVETFFSLLRGKRPNMAVRLRAGLYLKREYETIVLSCVESDEPRSAEEKQVPVPGVAKWRGSILRTTVLKKIPRSLNAGGNAAYFDYGKALPPLKVRYLRPGDRIQPLGMNGHKKLKDIFIDEKVPLARRKKVLLLTAGEKIMWAVGVKQSEAFRVRDTTKKVL
ncbi:MAG: tRNA lysidine(34) synthetase TilS, partial [Deltaproteobacteria bacterium]|nr:tRNA lysidine(34) synthetase TilS [Deltaproteobacteria bacterium]